MGYVYLDLKNCNSEEKAAKLLSEITWIYRGCSPDSKEQCQECLSDILRSHLEGIETFS